MNLIRKAIPAEYHAVRDFYYNLIDQMQDAEYHPAWQKGVYPSDEYLQASIEQGELFIGLADGQIAGAMIVNRAANEGYQTVSWPSGAAEDEVMLIHALGVLPSFSGRGYAKKLVAHALEYARESSAKAVRLDVLRGNIPAERLYPSAGFTHVDTIRMFYADTGWTEFLMYEYTL